MENYTINESELKDNLANGAVVALKLIEDHQGRFSILVKLSWKGGDIQLETQRKKVKKWSSLDRLVKHINAHYKNVPLIELHLRSVKNDPDDFP